MPKASAPKAPWVEVWLSPQTIVIPGWVRPCSGPITCTMPWLAIAHRVTGDAELRAVGGERLELSARDRVGDRLVDVVVGTLWSAVATVRSGRRTRRPASRRPSKAWGEVTSWTRCRSM